LPEGVILLVGLLLTSYLRSFVTIVTPANHPFSQPAITDVDRKKVFFDFSCIYVVTFLGYLEQKNNV